MREIADNLRDVCQVKGPLRLVFDYQAPSNPEINPAFAYSLAVKQHFKAVFTLVRDAVALQD